MKRWFTLRNPPSNWPSTIWYWDGTQAWYFHAHNPRLLSPSNFDPDRLARSKTYQEIADPHPAYMQLPEGL